MEKSTSESGKKIQQKLRKRKKNSEINKISCFEILPQLQTLKQISDVKHNLAKIFLMKKFLLKILPILSHVLQYLPLTCVLI
jgi:hypothetical protein